MATDQLQRPEFYEGQYLGAADLDAAVTYARLGHARHSLGAHTWGIAVGLQLREEPALAGGDAVDVFLQPGYAVDGFGRAIVVPTPVQLSTDLFGNEASGPVRVWIRYKEESTAAPAFGFEVCATDGTHARIVEDYEIVVGDIPSDELHDEVSVAGQLADAVEALHTLDDEAPLQCDGSIPFQEFPPPGDAHWLIPLGKVQWEVGPPSRLTVSSEETRRTSRTDRQYLGVVAEGIHAADGVIRLRDRATAPPPDASAASACADNEIHPEDDLAYDAGRVSLKELVWVEGNLRIVGDARLFGGKLEFRNSDGDPDGTRLWIQRTERNDLEGTDLQVLLEAGDDGENRLVIGQLGDDTGTVTDYVVVQDDGKVGLGITDQTEPLQVPLTVRGRGDREDWADLQAPNGTPAWRISRRTEKGTEGLNIAELDVPGAVTDARLFIETGGKVGIGTAEPAKPLTIRATGSGEELIGFEAPDGTTRWHLNQNLGGTTEGLNFAESDIADGRLFLQAGGNVGIGTTSPETSLHLRGGADPTLRIQSDGDHEVSGRLSLRQNNKRGADLYYDGTPSVEGFAIETFGFQGTSSGVQVVIKQSNGWVGLGTSTPQERLDVRGSIKMGASGDLFAVGALQNLRVIAGRVSGGGGAVSGTGFTASRTSQGTYAISLTPPFNTVPVVLATAVDATDDDNVATVRNLTSSDFDILIKSVGAENDLQDTAFTFIALGLRS